MPAPSPWNLDSGAVALRCGVLAAASRLDVADRGLGSVAVDGERIDAELLAVKSPHLDAADDAYVRGRDLTAVYGATEAFPFRTQLRWSASEIHDAGVALRMTLSLQTDLLDTAAEVVLATRLAGGQAAAWGDHAVAATAPAGQRVIIAPHVSDASQTESSLSAGGHELRLALPFLEKGVIRRCRLIALVLAAGVADATIDRALAEFEVEPLPLTD